MVKHRILLRTYCLDLSTAALHAYTQLIPLILKARGAMLLYGTIPSDHPPIGRSSYY